jgi:hypothetical protein
MTFVHVDGDRTLTCARRVSTADHTSSEVLMIASLSLSATLRAQEMQTSVYVLKAAVQVRSFVSTLTVADGLQCTVQYASLSALQRCDC